MFVADVLRASRQNARMLDSKNLITELERLRANGVTTNAEIGRLLRVPSSRVAEMFSGKRAIKIDEMKALVERYGLDQSGPPTFNAESLEPLLEAILPLAPPSGRMTDQIRRALASSLAYGLVLLGENPTSPASSDAVAVACRAAVARFREIMNGSSLA